MPTRSNSRTVTQIAVSQGAAGSTDLVVAPGAGTRIYVVAIVLVMDATGTLKFQEAGTTDLSGAMPIAVNGGFVVVSDDDTPVLSTLTANAKLNIVTATGKATGWVRYYLDN